MTQRLHKPQRTMKESYLIILLLLFNNIHAMDNAAISDLKLLVHQLYSENNPAARNTIADQILQQEIPIQYLVSALENGNSYTSKVKTGRIKFAKKRKNGYRYRYIIDAPTNYQYTTKYPVIFFLHGGVTRKKWSSTGVWWPKLPDLHNDQYIKVYPASWHQSKWWHDSQVNNIRSILGEVQSLYNIDTNKIYLSGLSDGGSGTYYISARIADLFAAAAPVIGSPSVIDSTSNDVHNETFPINLTGLPWLIINGMHDSLYPPKHIEPYIEFLKFMGVKFQLILANTGHSFEALKQNADRLFQFFSHTKRNPHPSELIWEVDQNSKFTRHHWLIIDEISQYQSKKIFHGFLEKHLPKALVKIKAHENTIHVESLSAQKITLLISPQKFNLKLPIQVHINGKVVHDEVVKPSNQVLLKWAIKDRDPARLYVAEIMLTIST